MSIPTGPGRPPQRSTPSPPGLGGLNTQGAVDLGALAAAREAQAKRAAAAEQARADGGAAATGSGVVVHVDEVSFQAEVVDRSLTVPVVIDFVADWCEPCKQLSPVLEKLAVEYAGRWLLAVVDVDANPRVAQAFGVQSIPALFAVIAGQPVPLFQGAVPEAQVRQVLDELLKVAAENGVTGTVAVDASPDVPAASAEAPDGPPSDPDLDAAADAVEAGDFDAAEAAYRRLLDRRPGDADGRAGLALVGVLRRTVGLQAQATLDAAEQAPDDVGAQLAAGDVLLTSGRVEDCFALLVAAVRRSDGDERDQVRARLLELFDVVGPQDPAVAPARRALANALF